MLGSRKENGGPKSQISLGEGPPISLGVSGTGRGTGGELCWWQEPSVPEMRCGTKVFLHDFCSPFFLSYHGIPVGVGANVRSYCATLRVPIIP